MRSLLGVPLAIALALAFIYGVVFGLGDTHVLVSPPEAVAEGFMRSLTTRRYRQALPFLNDELQERVTPEALKAYAQRLEAEHGKIKDVKGEAGWMKGDRAEAHAVLQTDQGKEVKHPIRLERSEGAWSVSDFGGRNK
jgi:ABC-type transporter MlaC component